MKSSRPAPPPRVLVIDPDASTRRSAARALMDAELSVLTAESVEAALSLLGTHVASVAMLGVELLGPPPRDAIARLRASQRELPIVLTATSETLERAPSLATRDDVGLLVKPPPVAGLWVHAAARAMAPPSSGEEPGQRARDDEAHELVGVSSAARDAFRVALAAADTDAPLLLLGEHGTGRERIARAVHHRSRRRSSPFVVFGCSAPREDERERLLFGPDGSGGAYAAAATGTLYLDDVAALPTSAQERLAKLMESPPPPRVIASGAPDLFATVRSEAMRQDLYFRLAVVEVLVPPLRRRREDIPLLAHRFLRRAAEAQQREVQRLGPETVRALTARPWPGNVDELRAVIERAVALSRGETLYPADLPAESTAAPRTDERREASAAPPAHVELPYADAKARALDEFHRSYLGELLRRSEGNVSEAARRAGLDRANFRRVLRKTEPPASRKR